MRKFKGKYGQTSSRLSQASSKAKIALMDSIIEQMERVWGPEGFGGDWPEYEWLLKAYGITEEEDVQWQFVLGWEYWREDMEQEDLNDEELMAFLANDEAVCDFLRQFLAKYQAGNSRYPRPRHDAGA